MLNGKDIPRLLNELREQYPDRVNIVQLREGTGISHGSAQNAFDSNKYPKSRDLQNRIISWIYSFYENGHQQDQPYDLMARGDVKLKSGKFRDALHLYESAIEQATNPNLKRELEVKAAQAHISLREPASAKAYIEQVNADSEYWEGRVALLQGALGYAEGNWNAAQDDLTKAVDILCKHHEPSACMNAIMRLIGIHYYSDNLDEAKRWVLQALSLASRTESAGRIATLYGHSGDIALRHGDWEQAESYILRGLHLAEEIDSVDTSGYLRTLYAQYHLRRGDPQEAINHLHVAARYTTCSGNPDRMVWIDSLLAEAHHARRNTEKAHHYANEALQRAHSIDSLRLPEALFAKAFVTGNNDYAYRAIDAAQKLQQTIKVSRIENWLAERGE